MLDGADRDSAYGAERIDAGPFGRHSCWIVSARDTDTWHDHEHWVCSVHFRAI